MFIHFVRTFELRGGGVGAIGNQTVAMSGPRPSFSPTPPFPYQPADPNQTADFNQTLTLPLGVPPVVAQEPGRGGRGLPSQLHSPPSRKHALCPSTDGEGGASVIKRVLAQGWGYLSKPHELYTDHLIMALTPTLTPTIPPHFEPHRPNPNPPPSGDPPVVARGSGGGGRDPPAPPLRHPPVRRRPAPRRRSVRTTPSPPVLRNLRLDLF